MTRAISLKEAPARIIELNNHGVQCLESAVLTTEYEKAIQVLTEAFRLSKAFLAAFAREVEGRTHFSHSVTELDQWMMLTMSTTIHKSTDSDADQEGDAEAFMYNKPIYIPPSCQVAPDDIVIPVTITFNLGLAYQMVSRNSKHCQMDLSHKIRIIQQAIKFYQHSFQLQRLRSSSPTLSPMFFMTIMNNLGVLYSTIGSIDAADECFHNLLSFLMLIHTTSSENDAQQQQQQPLPEHQSHCTSSSQSPVNRYKSSFFQNATRWKNSTNQSKKTNTTHDGVIVQCAGAA